MDRPALHVAVAVCVLLAGCSLLGPSHTREARATAALENASDALNGTDTYHFESDLSVVATADDRTESVRVDLVGSVDTVARELWTNATRDGETYESYVLNRTAYQECGGPGPWWGKTEVEGDWDAQTPARRQLALLRSGSLYWNGTDTVDGESAVVLLGEPTTDALTRYSERRSGSVFGGPNVENAHIRVWLDAETHRPLRTRLSFEVSEGGNTASATMTTRFTGYGDPISVEVPPEAREDSLELGCPGS